MYIRGGDAKIATDTKSLDSPCAYHVSNGDAIKANISKVGSVMRLFQQGVY